MSTETASFCVNASFALRGATKSSIKQEAWRRGLRLEIDEDKGWFSSTYYFTVSGPGAVQFQRDCIQWLESTNEEVRRTAK